MAYPMSSWEERYGAMECYDLLIHPRTNSFISASKHGVTQEEINNPRLMQNELCQLGHEVQKGGEDYQGHSQQCKRQRRREGGRETVEWGRLWGRDQDRVQRAVEEMEVSIIHPPLGAQGAHLSPGGMGTAHCQGYITRAQP